MSLFDLFLVAVGLSMDAFAVSICKGFALRSIRLKHCLICGAWFGGFQALMPLIGYFIGARFLSLVASFDHWIAFVLLCGIGANMIWEALHEKDDAEQDPSLGLKTMLLLAIATSIDALATGLNFAFLEGTNILAAVLFIGCITFVLSMIGVKVGSVFGVRYRARTEVLGGVVLIFLGFKILLEHLGVIG